MIRILKLAQNLECLMNANVRLSAQPTGYQNGLIIRTNLVLVSYHNKFH